MPPFMIALALLSVVAGLNDQQLVATLSDEERAQLEEQFGSVENGIFQARALAEDFGFDTSSLAEFFPGNTFEQQIVPGNQATFTDPNTPSRSFTGRLDVNPQGQFFLTRDDGFSVPVEQVNGQFVAIGPEGENLGALTGAPSTPGQIVGNLTQERRDEVPDAAPAVDFGQRFGGESPEEVVFRLRDELGLERVSVEDLLPDRLPDPDVFEAEERASLFGREEELVEQGRTTAQRGLVEAGILPSSAAFGFETRQAPQLESEGRIATELTNIAGEREAIVGRNAELEAGALRDRASINAELAAIEGRLIGTVGDFIIGGEGLNLQTDVAQQNANTQTFQSQIASFNAEEGVIDRALEQFNLQITTNAQLGLAGQQLATELLINRMKAELADNPSLLLTTDLISTWISQASGLAGIQLALNPPDGGGGSSFTGALQPSFNFGG